MIYRMYMSSAWLSELEMEDEGYMNQYYETFDNLSVDSFSSENYTENPCFTNQSFQTSASIQESVDFKLHSDGKGRSMNKKISPTPKPDPIKPCTTNTFTLSFGDVKPKEEITPFSDDFYYPTVGHKKGSTTTRNRVQAQDHVLAERKRRQMLSRRFISLSSLLPNLKKMDKASVLEDATNYIKELQGRVKELEGLSGTKQNDVHESIVSVKRSKLSGSDDSSTDETNCGEISNPSCKSSPEVEVRMSGGSFLVRIQCQKNLSCCLVKALTEMQKIGLSVISSSAMPFANTTLLITIVAQMEDDLFMTETDILKKLQLAF